jgi:hypothetical protein
MMRRRESLPQIVHLVLLKGTVSKYISKFLEIFASQGAPPVSMTLAANFATSSAGVVDTGGKMTLVSTTPAANLAPVSMTPVANNGTNIRLGNLEEKIYRHIC